MSKMGRKCLPPDNSRIIVKAKEFFEKTTKTSWLYARIEASGMEDIFFTVTGCNHYFGTEAFKPRVKVTLYKEPDNKYDKEAIRVEARALGKIGYVANSPYTVLGESRSAGRLYDLIDDGATGRVLYVLPQGLVCELEETGFEKVKKIYKKHRHY